MKYSKYKGYSLNPTKSEYIAKNYNAFSTLRRVDFAEDTGRLASQINEVLELNIPIHIVEDIWEDYSAALCAQFMIVGNNAEENVRRVIELTDWFVEDATEETPHIQIYKSFHKWKEEGRDLILGERSYMTNDAGVPVFAFSQTTPNNKLYKTFAAWQEEGRSVIVGEKSHKRNDDGVAVFALNQTISKVRECPEYKKMLLDCYEEKAFAYGIEDDEIGRFYEWEQEY